MLVGFGAGSSYFDAIVELRDGGTGEIIGTIDVDKNSWGLGSLMAAGQTVERFMQGAAKKVAAMLEAARVAAAVNEVPAGN